MISVCGNGETVMSCSPLLLATAKCPLRPEAVPLINPCGGCSVSFYVEGEIIEDCLERKGQFTLRENESEFFFDLCYCGM